MKRVEIHPDAEEELRSGVAYYEAQRLGLGHEFMAEVQDAINRIRANPGMYPRYDESDARKCPIRRFPYTLFYADLDDYIWIAAVAHQSRQPGYWSQRTPG